MGGTNIAPAADGVVADGGATGVADGRDATAACGG
jgi:hypothetical protein